MIGSFLTRGLVLIFGYAFPAYECYKTVEKNKPELEQLRFWCQYWILVAILTVFERIGDTFVSWLPMYSEAKLAFYIYLWYPKTKGTTYVYGSFFKPYVSKHEMEIDRNLMELRTRAGDMMVLYFQKAASYGQTRIFEVLQFVAVQSSPASRSNQNQPEQQAPRAARQPVTAPRRQTPARPTPPVEDPPSPTSSTSSTQHQREVEPEVSSSPSAASPAPQIPQNPPRRLLSAPANTSQSSPKKTPHLSNPESPNHPQLKKATSVPPETTVQSAPEPIPMQIDLVPPRQDNATPSAPPETRMEETIRVTRNRLRKARSTTTNP